VESLQHTWHHRNGKNAGYHKRVLASRGSLSMVVTEEGESSDGQSNQFLANIDHLDRRTSK